MTRSKTYNQKIASTGKEPNGQNMLRVKEKEQKMRILSRKLIVRKDSRRNFSSRSINYVLILDNLALEIKSITERG